MSEKLNIEHVNACILKALGEWYFKDYFDDCEELNDYFDRDLSELEDGGFNLTCLEFYRLTGLTYISHEEELGDIDKAYWNCEIIFGKGRDYYRATYSRSDRGYWGGLDEVKELTRVKRIEKEVIIVTYEEYR